MKSYYEMYVGERAKAMKERWSRMMDTYGDDFIEEYARKTRARNAFDAEIALGADMKVVYRNSLADIMLHELALNPALEHNPFTKEEFRDYIDNVYLPEAKRIYAMSVNWFANNLRAHAPQIAQMIEEAGGILDTASYNGAEDNYRIFAVYDNEGNMVCEVYYDPSAQAFDVNFVI